jgi:hypothetical protein
VRPSRLELDALTVQLFGQILFLVCRQWLYTLNSYPKIEYVKAASNCLELYSGAL